MVRLPNANRWGTVQIPFPVPVNRPFNHDAPAPWFFHAVLAQLAELQSPRCIYNIARTLKASRRSCRPLQNRRRCREWPKTMQRKTEKPHGYSFSEHPCGFMAWSRIRDSNPPPTAWEVWKVQIQRLRTIQFYNEISPHSFETVFFGFVLFRMNNAQITHKTVAQ